MTAEISREQQDRLTSNYRLVKDSIERACEKSQRDPSEITLVAVSKTVDADVIAFACDLGIEVFGENRPQTLQQKAEWILENRPDLEHKLSWHMIGHIQRNKARQTSKYAALLHSVDSERLADKLSEIGQASEVKIPVLAQIKLSGEETKFGVQTNSAADFARNLSKLPGIEVLGLMGMASFTSDEKIVRGEFSTLKRLFDELNDLWTAKGILSMGMSSDFEWAIEEGATHVRVGSSLFRF